MKKILYTVALLTFFGCSDDYLETASETQLAEDNLYTSEAGVRLGINGVYAALQDQNLYGGNLNASIGLPHYDVLGDNAYNQYEWEGGGIFMEGTLDPSHFSVDSHYTPLYRVIGRANTAIQSISLMTDAQIDPDAKNNYLAQARFIRALMYFNLAVYFEDVPLVTEPQSLADAYIPKSAYSEIIAQVIDDLTFAKDNLLDPSEMNPEYFGYATKGSALGLLARVKLQEGEYADVLDLTAEAMTLGYSLHPSYSQLFTIAGETSNEIMFSVRFIEGSASNNGETHSGTFLGTPKVDSRPMPNLVNDFYCTDGLPITSSPLYSAGTPGANRDPRCGATIYFGGDIFLTDLSRAFNAGTSPTGFGHRKYIRTLSQSAEGIGASGGGSQDFYVLRYADLLLMRAEAMVETGNLTGAIDLVDQIRTRVSMPSVASVEGTGLSQEEVRSIVRHERRVELALEGLRFMDLKRWGEIENAFSRALADNITGYSPAYLGAKSEVFPLPLGELSVNSQLEQHPAWK